MGCEGRAYRLLAKLGIYPPPPVEELETPKSFFCFKTTHKVRDRLNQPKYMIQTANGRKYVGDFGKKWAHFTRKRHKVADSLEREMGPEEYVKSGDPLVDGVVLTFRGLLLGFVRGGSAYPHQILRLDDSDPLMVGDNS